MDLVHFGRGESDIRILSFDINCRFIPTAFQFVFCCSKSFKNCPNAVTSAPRILITLGQLDTSKLYPVLMSSQLSKPVLGQLWSLVNKQTVGVLTVPECTALLALMALAQVSLLLTNDINVYENHQGKSTRIAH